MPNEEQTLRYFKDKSAEEVHDVVLGRITGTLSPPVGDARLNESPEDVIIEALNSSALPEATRSTIILVMLKMLCTFNWALYRNRFDEDSEDIMVRIFRIIDITAPAEVKSVVQYMICDLTLARDAQIPERIAGAIVRGYMGYDQQESDIPLWELLIEKDMFAGYAWNALLSIDPQHKRMDRHLATLERKVMFEGWTLKVNLFKKWLIRARTNNTDHWKK